MVRLRRNRTRVSSKKMDMDQSITILQFFIVEKYSGRFRGISGGSCHLVDLAVLKTIKT